MPVNGSVMRRKMLLDITNTARAVEAAGDGENDTVDNPALLKLLYEKNKIIEMSGMELQNLRTALQKAHQQNWQLAQANSRMLGELNQGKDRVSFLYFILSLKLLVRITRLFFAGEDEPVI
ncbi:putative shugoshin, plant [Dioscorea sansibarensis]